jgi:TonB family protein
METVAQPPADAELHLLTEWGDPAGRTRTRRAAVLSVLAHGALIGVLALLPDNFLAPPPRQAEVKHIITPLIEPLTELTQKAPNTGKINKEFNATELHPRPRVQMPNSPPPSTRPAAPPPRVASVPPPAPKAAPVAALPEPPKVEQAVNAPPKADMPALPVPAPPQIQAAEEKPKSPFENVTSQAPATRARGQSQIPVPDPSLSGVMRQSGRGDSSAGMVVGDGPGYGNGINLPPAPGSQGNSLQLLSDPLGVDFRPYLTQILATVKRNWLAIMPQSVQLGRRGKTAIQFSIARNGSVPKLVIASASGTEALDRAAIAAISASNPFPPLPAEFKGDRVVLQFNFAYNMPRQ